MPFLERNKRVIGPYFCVQNKTIQVNISYIYKTCNAVPLSSLNFSELSKTQIILEFLFQF